MLFWTPPPGIPCARSLPFHNALRPACHSGQASKQRACCAAAHLRQLGPHARRAHPHQRHHAACQHVAHSPQPQRGRRQQRRHDRLGGARRSRRRSDRRIVAGPPGRPRPRLPLLPRQEHAQHGLGPQHELAQHGRLPAGQELAVGRCQLQPVRGSGLGEGRGVARQRGGCAGAGACACVVCSGVGGGEEGLCEGQLGRKHRRGAQWDAGSKQAWWWLAAWRW